MMIDEPKGKIFGEAGPGKCWSPVEPVLVLNGSTLSWKEEENMKYYLHSNFLRRITGNLSLRFNWGSRWILFGLCCRWKRICIGYVQCGCLFYLAIGL